MDLEQKARERADIWTREPYDEYTRKYTRELLNEGGDELIDAFYRDLDFGTGGLRGKMGVGTNRINRYTLGMATQGLANYLKGQVPGQSLRVAIAYDCRHNSKTFAGEVSEVLSANGIQVYLYERLRPTPQLSFAIRYLHCHAGIVITASHNPPEYNGYKVYWRDGGQLVPPHDQGVIEEVRQVKPEEVLFGGSDKRIQLIGKDLDEAYLEEVSKICLTHEGKDQLKIVFTPIHGTTITTLPQAMRNCGFTQVEVVKEQATPDGDFSTVESPNPEEAEALSMAVGQAEKNGADLVLGTDPDGDRVGMAVRNLNGDMELINGNQAASVFIYYQLEQWQKSGRLKGREFIAKTIVTTDLLDRMAEHYGVECPNVLTGFKWIADIIRQYEGKKKFITGGEESYGYMVGDFVRDKDAIASSVMLCEAAAWAKARGTSFYQLLIEVYQRFGFYLEDLVSMKKDGHRGASEIAEMMQQFRKNTPTQLAGEKVTEMRDYQAGVIRDMDSGSKLPLDIPQSNVVQFFTERGTKVTARPSGTEPKIKFYISVNQKLPTADDYARVKGELQERIARIRQELGL